MTELRQLHLRGALGAVRTEMWEGREHLVVPCVALQEGVIHAINASAPEFVPSSTLLKSYQKWQGHPLVVGHPVRDGKQISAHDPAVLERHGFGLVRHGKMNGTRLGLEALVDPARLELLGQAQLLKDLREGKPIEVSVGAFVTTSATSGSHLGRAYSAQWEDITPDHLAFLPGGVGACSLAAGCGANRMAASTYLVTAEEFTEFKALVDPAEPRTAIGARNSAKDFTLIQDMHDRAVALGAACSPKTAEAHLTTLSGASLDERMSAVQKAVDLVFGAFAPQTVAGGGYAQRIYDDYAIVARGNDTFKVGYSVAADGTVTLADDAVRVKMEYVAAASTRDCPACDGSGSKDGNPCEVCEGNGELKTAKGSPAICTACAGTGKVDEKDCAACSGTGEKMKTLGGPGSGNFGHAGRPGSIGGSSDGGGSGAAADGPKYSTENGMRSRFWRGDEVQTPDGKTGTVQAVYEGKDGKTAVTIGSLSSEAPGPEYDEKDLRARRMDREDQADKARDRDNAKYRSHDGYDGSPTPVEDDRVKIMGKVYGAGEKGIVRRGDRDGSFVFVVDKNGKSLGSYHVSNLKVLASSRDCPACDGSGSKDGNPCEVCEGNGELKTAKGSPAICTACAGTGQINGVDCEACSETGNLKAAEELDDQNDELTLDEQLLAKAAAGEAAFKAACGCQGEGTMTQEAKADIIKALVECKYSGFTAGDEEMLRGASDARLESFRVAAESRAATDKDLRAAADRKLTAEEFMAVAPPELRSLITRQQTQETNLKAELITQLKAAQSEYSEAELSVMPVADLSRMARMAKVEVRVDYAGKGLPRLLSSDEEDFTPPNPYDKQIKALQAARTH